MDMQALMNDLKFVTSWMESRPMNSTQQMDRYGPPLGSKPTSMNVSLCSKILLITRKLQQAARPPLPHLAPNASGTTTKQTTMSNPTCPLKITTTLGKNTANCPRQRNLVLK